MDKRRVVAPSPAPVAVPHTLLIMSKRDESRNGKYACINSILRAIRLQMEIDARMTVSTVHLVTQNADNSDWGEGFL
jgi:hypothetical protein